MKCLEEMNWMSRFVTVMRVDGLMDVNLIVYGNKEEEVLIIIFDLMYINE